MSKIDKMDTITETDTLNLNQVEKLVEDYGKKIIKKLTDKVLSNKKRKRVLGYLATEVLKQFIEDTDEHTPRRAFIMMRPDMKIIAEKALSNGKKKIKLTNFFVVDEFIDYLYESFNFEVEYTTNFRDNKIQSIRFYKPENTENSSKEE